MEAWEKPLTLKQVAYVLEAAEDEKTEEAVFGLIEAGKLPPSALFDDDNPEISRPVRGRLWKHT
ncbi:hypothetical protein [Pelobacter propionicus]|uniref:hypothetical protein n=1 Tax=Pelobacter propionicus TaxID=29543 RepID=UPI000312E5C2|nr:hypothetical protein [Pelobacter propionicus]